MNLLDGELVGRTFTVPTGFTIDVDGMAATGPLILGVRPDDLVPVAASGGDEAATAHVTLIELLGPRAIVTIEARGTELTSVVETARLTGITEGAAVALSVRPGAAQAFDARTQLRLTGA